MVGRFHLLMPNLWKALKRVNILVLKNQKIISCQQAREAERYILE